MSRCVPSEDLGKVFAMLASVESILPIVGSNLYSNLYNATSDLEYPWMGSFYFAAAGFTIIGITPLVRVGLYVKLHIYCPSKSPQNENIQILL